jgi:thiol:disulfide interchange protein DsbG
MPITGRGAFPMKLVAVTAIAGIIAAAVAAVLAGHRWRGASAPCAATLPALEIAPRVDALIRESSRGNAHLQRLLSHPYAGLIGAVVASGRERFIAWVAPDCHALLVGALFGRTGQNATTQATYDAGIDLNAPDSKPPDSKAPDSTPPDSKPPDSKPPDSPLRESAIPPSPDAAEELLRAASAAQGVTEGSRGPIVQAFIDLSCSFCGLLYAQLRPLIHEGRLRVHWIPVAVLSETSRSEAADVLEARDPRTVLEEKEGGRPRMGVELRQRQPRLSTLGALDVNNDLLRRANDGVAATPVILFRSREGRVSRMAGALHQPGDLLANLPAGN